MNKIVKLESHGKWVKVFYKTAKGRKIYSLFVASQGVMGNMVKSFFFEGGLV